MKLKSLKNVGESFRELYQSYLAESKSGYLSKERRLRAGHVADQFYYLHRWIEQRDYDAFENAVACLVFANNPRPPEEE